MNILANVWIRAGLLIESEVFMVSDKMKELLSGSSVIRSMFEDGKKMAAEFGKENVYDLRIS